MTLPYSGCLMSISIYFYLVSTQPRQTTVAGPVRYRPHTLHFVASVLPASVQVGATPGTVTGVWPHLAGAA